MANIYIIDNIRINRQGLQTKGANGSWIPLHCQQGRLDGACAVYSSIMALLCIGYLDESDIEIMTKPDRRTRKGKFLYHLFEQQGLIRDGYYLKKLAKEMQTALSDYVVTYCDGDISLDEIRKYLDRGQPVILGLSNSNREFSHAIVAIGMEYEGEGDETRIIRILCLDPGYNISKTSYWNCVVDVNRNSSGEHPYWYITDEDSFKVNIEDMITIEI
jgi:hypothetical protein